MSTKPKSIAMHHLQWLLAHIELEKDETSKVIGRTVDGEAITVSACPVNRRIDLRIGTDEDGDDREHVERIDMTEPTETVVDQTWGWMNRLTGLERDGLLEHRELG